MLIGVSEVVEIELLMTYDLYHIQCYNLLDEGSFVHYMFRLLPLDGPFVKHVIIVCLVKFSIDLHLVVI